MSEKECFKYAQWAVKELKNMSVKEVREHYIEVIEVLCKQENTTLTAIEFFRCLVNFVIEEKERQSISA